MLRGQYEDGDTMKAFFKGNIKVENQGPKYERVELGHGLGVGYSDGSYNQYVKQLRSRPGNCLIYTGKGINTDNDIMSILDETEEFNEGEIPKLLITLHNIINEKTIKVEWKDMDNDIILEQHYQTPPPYAMNYTWWDTYGVYFIGPDNLEEGDYKIDITLREIVRDRKLEELSPTIQFSVKDNSTKDKDQ